MMIRIKNISKSYEGKEILNNINLEINDRDKIALVGNNGTGKSTLLKIIAGNESPDSGQIENPSNQMVGYLPQEISIENSEKNITNYIKECIGIKEIEEKMEAIQENLEDEEKLNEFCELQEEYMRLDGYDFEYKLETVLSGLNLKRRYGEKNKGAKWRAKKQSFIGSSTTTKQRFIVVRRTNQQLRFEVN